MATATALNEFRKTGIWKDDLGKVPMLEGLDLDGIPGIVYLGGNAYIEIYTKDDVQHFCLTIGNEGWTTETAGETLETLEERLYFWCESEGMFED